ncbi:hypothetical protein BDV24DRAFT_161832 [Aspergillus arachidicola]|uniref:Peptidase metallopeptidase domain-containing protein n=1 Tax=Aspergillus arachidicola TaxID=656916 RepID=A0A5N6YC01_9EURO|nr:hypothetical protein BDV24DRAFT_161832 [Aspergillus arachidicola]
MSFCSSIEPDAREADPSLYGHIKDREVLQRLSLAICDTRKWPVGTELRVRFLPRDENNPDSIDGTQEHKEQVRIHAPTWTENTSISFKFLDDNSTKEDIENAEIRIQFQTGYFGDSCVGTECKDVSAKEPTISFGVGGVLKRLILHEFGHALGAMHEHSSPRAILTWKEDRVIESYRKRDMYSEYNDEGKRAISATDFDTRSIMIYAIHSTWTEEGVQIEMPDGLSERDKEWIQTAYPPAAVTVYGGRFSGPAVIFSRTPDSPRGQHLAQDSQYHIGWTSLRNKRRNPLSIASQHFKTHLRSSGNFDGFLRCLGNWFAPETDDRNFQVGAASFDAETTFAQKPMIFSRNFDQPPEVIVWLQDIDMNVTNAGQFSVDAKPANITEEGFELRIKWTGEESRRHSAKVSWIACVKSSRISDHNLDFNNFTLQNGFTEAINIATGSNEIKGIYHGIKGFRYESSHVTQSGLVQVETHIRDRTRDRFTIVTKAAGAVDVKVACLVIYK